MVVGEKGRKEERERKEKEKGGGRLETYNTFYCKVIRQCLHSSPCSSLLLPLSPTLSLTLTRGEGGEGGREGGRGELFFSPSSSLTYTVHCPLHSQDWQFC